MSAAKIERYPITIDGETVQIGTANELAAALDVLQGQHDREALTQLRPHLAEIIAHARGLMAVMKALAPDDQVFLIEALGAGLAGVMQDATRLRDQLATLAESRVEEALLRTLGAAGMQQLILTADELAEVLEWVYGECDWLALELLGFDTVRALCRQAHDLSAILHNLDGERQDRLMEKLGWPFMVSLVRDGRDLAYLLRALPPASSELLLGHFTGPELAALTSNPRDREYLYQRLEPEEARLLDKLLGAGK